MAPARHPSRSFLFIRLLSAPGSATVGVPAIATWFRDPSDPVEFGIVERDVNNQITHSVITIAAQATQGTVQLTFDSPGQFVLPAVDLEASTQVGAGPQIGVVNGGPTIIAPTSTSSPPLVTKTTTSPTAPITITLSITSTVNVVSLSTHPTSTTTEIRRVQMRLNHRNTVILMYSVPSPSVISTAQPSQPTTSPNSSSSSSSSSSANTATVSTSPPLTESSSSESDSSSHTSPSPTEVTSSSSSTNQPPPSTGGNGSTQSQNLDQKKQKVHMAIILSVILAVFVLAALFWIFVIKKQHYANQRRLDAFRMKLNKMGFGWAVGCSSMYESSSSDSESRWGSSSSAGVAHLNTTRTPSGTQSFTSSFWNGDPEERNGHNPSRSLSSSVGSPKLEGSGSRPFDRMTLRSFPSTMSLGFGNWSSHMREREERHTQIMARSQNDVVEEGGSEEAFARIDTNHIPNQSSASSYPFTGTGSGPIPGRVVNWL
ncbi:hypothetical protein K435DRAFT_841070 [Dendrothele bispora CBS 962.96]|uniref:Uncharacterized protein n=1 Tax=Dendrothele bispora (strain CBS 962.96) TaxID=1314807 RepID=A0A4S8LQC5_DENBC|nr:hypothetical protein K435DRAFT_841070 [Dendrothele bispora CBS 962.96]